jgi:outer membrane lipoprotein-sorting protein
MRRIAILMIVLSSALPVLAEPGGKIREKPKESAKRAVQDSATRSLLEHLNTVQARIHTMTADFTDTVRSPVLRAPLVAKGRIYITKPSSVLWEYSQPETMRFVIANDEYVGYFPKRKSAERKNIHRWREQIRFMSLGQSAEELEEFFDIRLDAAAPAAKGTSVLVLAPTKRRVRKHIEEIRLTVDAGTYLPVQVDWRMPDGSTRVLQLRNVAVNPPISDSLYVVRIPADFKVTTGFSFPGAGLSE